MWLLTSRARMGRTSSPRRSVILIGARLDIVVANAGISKATALEDNDSE